MVRRPRAGARPWRPRPTNLGLTVGEIHVFAFGLEPPASRVEALEGLLSGDELARARSFRSERDARRFIAGRAGMRSILGDYLNREPSSLCFRYDKHGKPGLESADRVRFNMSGSHDLGVLAVQPDRELGVDVERVRPFAKALALAERHFTREEHAALQALEPEEIDTAFFSIWTRKEAVLKCLGRGLSHPMSAFSLATKPTDSAERVELEGLGGRGSQWVFSLPDPSEGYAAALATEGTSCQVKCYSWDGP